MHQQLQLDFQWSVSCSHTECSGVTLRNSSIGNGSHDIEVINRAARWTERRDSRGQYTMEKALKLRSKIARSIVHLERLPAQRATLMADGPNLPIPDSPCKYSTGLWWSST